MTNVAGKSIRLRGVRKAGARRCRWTGLIWTFGGQVHGDPWSFGLRQVDDIADHFRP